VGTFYPSAERFKILKFFILKFKKKRVPPIIHSLVLVIDKYRYGEILFHRKVKTSQHTVNPPIEYKQISISQLPHSEISKCKGIFHKRSKFVDSLGIVKVS
jgi:hypothetical protein